MRLRRWVLFLLVCALFCSVVLPVQAAERSVRKRESYSYFSDEQLMELLRLDASQFSALKEDIHEAIMTQSPCNVRPYALRFGDQDVLDALSGMIYLHPEYFFLEYFSYTADAAAGILTTLNFTYQGSYDASMQRYEAFVEAADELLCPIRGVPSLSDLEKALLVHDALALRCEYDVSDNTGEARYDPYGALVNGKAACQGYTEAYAYLLMQLGIPCGLCKSDVLSHAWNIVEIDGKEYHVDVTWDDPTVDLSGRVRHENFLRSTQGLVANGHIAPDMTAKPTNTEFDNAFWLENDSAFCLCGGEIYCLSSGKLCRWSDGKCSPLCEIPDWNGYYNFLATDGEDLYVSSFYTIYRYDFSANAWQEAYALDLNAHKNFCIYGFTIHDGEFIIDINDSYNMTPEAKKEHQIRYRYCETDGSGHKYEAESVLREPSCTEAGLAAGRCSRCGKSGAEYPLPAKGHAWDKGTVTLEPTQTSTGVKTYRCTRCTQTKQETLPKKQSTVCDGGEGCVCKQFTDVAGPNDWTHKGIGFAIRNGLFSGMSATRFEPETAMTRAMLVTVLWRYAGKPIEGKNSFKDVPNGQWYTEAVTWAAHNGVVAGVGEGRFDPDGKITREQMAAILYRYATKVGIDTSKRTALSFPDAKKVSSYAQDALQWAVSEGLVSGSKENGVTYLHPQGNATRAQVASILMRFIENVAA